MRPSALVLAAGLAACSPVTESHAQALPVVDAPGAFLTESLPDVAERVTRGVVSVDTQAVPDEIIHQFQRGMLPGHMLPQGTGSGVIIDVDGTIITNHHVIDGATRVSVTLHDGRAYPVDVVGQDPYADIAVLRIVEPPRDLQPLEWGDSQALRLGETVLAVGNPFGMGNTLTRGIVSAKGRAGVGRAEYQDYIQTDAAINPGNSGGALVDMQGRLIGIPTMILSRTGGSNGIGLAISESLARALSDDIRDDGQVDRGWLGVSIQPAPNGVRIRGVGVDTAAQRSGLLVEDVVTTYNGAPVEALDAFRTAVAMTRPGEHFEMVVDRGGKTVRIAGELDRRPDPERN